jgi:hypothetical protein
MSHHTRGVTKKDVGEDVTEALTPLQMCQACNEVSIELPCTGFKLNCDEECHICAVCFSKCESGRHCQPSFECPACKSSCNQWTIKYERIQSTRRAGAPRKTIESYTTKEIEYIADIDLDPDCDPVRYHQGMANHSGGENFVGLTLSTAKGSDIVSTTEFYLIEGDSSDMGEDQVHLLEEIFLFLHSLLITNDKERTDRNFCPGGTPCDSDSLSMLAFNDYTPLHRVLHCLGYGDLLRNCPFETDAPNWDKLAITTFAVTDIIRYLRSSFPGLIKSTISNLLKAHGVETGVFKFLNEIGVATAAVSANRNQHAQYAEKLELGLTHKLQRHDYINQLFDNCGYKIGGVNVSYMDFVLLYWAITERDKMIPSRIYDDPYNQTASATQALSRKRKDWEVEREKQEVNFDTVMAPKPEDYTRMGHCLLSIADEVLKLEAAGKMYSYEEAQTMLENQNYLWIHTMPHLFGRKLDPDVVAHGGGTREDDDTNTSEAEDEDEAEAEDEEVDRATILERNNAFADTPMQLNLAKKSTCQLLVDYAMEVQNKALACNVEDECWDTVRPILEDVPILLSCDGAPATMVAKSKLKDPESVPAGIDAGGFHLLLASYKALGNLSRSLT